MQGEWYVLSRINWFEKGWSCFRGNFSLTPPGRDAVQNLTCSWSFHVPLLGTQHMVDQLSSPGDASPTDVLSLRSLSMPSWLRKILQEEHRGVRVIDIAPPPIQGSDISWVVLFDCGNLPTPSGELFVLSRTPTLPSHVLAGIRSVVAKNGITDFELLGLCGNSSKWGTFARADTRETH